MTQLSVNINKIATLRNARGGNVPNLIKVAKDIESFGAHGITVHPRPDGRHIRRDDVYRLKENLKVEFNIEGYPSDDFLAMVREVKPAQVTFVPDAPDAITSNNGWDVKTHQAFLQKIIEQCQSDGIRTSIFLNPNVEDVKLAATTGTNRIELYTESFAKGFLHDKDVAIAPYVSAANRAVDEGLGLNAGHDLSLENLSFFCTSILSLMEVSIGHALISDALYYGLENTVAMYLRACTTH
ncbi:MAG: pyridoxine 5'-phosphate synthase [Flavobacteriales bacterium]